MHTKQLKIEIMGLSNLIKISETTISRLQVTYKFHVYFFLFFEYFLMIIKDRFKSS
jgi:hypothetical protein